MNILPELIIISLSFLTASISSAIIVCKMMGLVDPRSYGSKNPGATNVLRGGNKKAAIIVLLADTLKGFIPVIIAWYLDFELFSVTLVVFASFLGHTYPIWFGFKGGKGVATFLGSLLALNPLIGVSYGLIWLFVAKVLKISSVSALTASAIIPIIFYYITKDINASYVIIIIVIWIFWNHRSNIANLLKTNKTN